MPQQIFRQSYLDQQNTSNTTQILIRAGLSHRIIFITIIILSFLLVTFITLGQYTKKSYLDGVVVPSTGLITVRANQSGIISTTDIKEGQFTPKSEKLLTINSDTFDNNGVSINQRLRSSLNQQILSLEGQRNFEHLMSQSRVEELESKISRLNLEIDSAKQSLAFAQERTLIKQKAGHSYSTLLNKKYISELTYQEHLSNVVSLQAAEESQKLLIQQLERERIAALHQKSYLELQGNMRELELKRLLDNLVQQQIELTSTSEIVINSPVSGQVTSLRAEVGQAISQGDVLLNIIPEGSGLQVELYAPSRAVGFLRAGQEVGLRFDAFPYEKFGIQKGKILKISQSTLSPNELKAQDQTIRADGETLYKIAVLLDKPTINIYGKEESLKVGMKVSASINLETRRLYEWLLGPIANFQGGSS